jgi:hypothetical protein
MLKSSPIIIGTVWATVLVLFISAAPARDLGQWEGADHLTREWFNGLMRARRAALALLWAGGCLLGRQL